jgi:hypothetical protein
VLKAKHPKGCGAKLKGLTQPEGRYGSQFPLQGAKALKVNLFLYISSRDPPLDVPRAKQLKSCDAKLQGLTQPEGRHGSQFPRPSAKSALMVDLFI